MLFPSIERAGAPSVPIDDTVTKPLAAAFDVCGSLQPLGIVISIVPSMNGSEAVKVTVHVPEEPALARNGDMSAVPAPGAAPAPEATNMQTTSPKTSAARRMLDRLFISRIRLPTEVYG